MPDNKTVVIKTLESSDGTKVIYPRTSINAIYKDDGTKANIVILDESGKIPVEQLPDEATGSGIPLEKATNITTISEGGRIGIRWTDPEDIEVDGITLSSFGGTKLVRNKNSYPRNSSDGILVVDSKIRNQYSENYFYDEGLINETEYYYKLFTYNTGMKFNNLPENEFTVTPHRIALSAIPSQSGTLIYNGSPQTPTWNDYNPNELNISETPQTNPGTTYSSTFEPKPNYCWPDGSYGSKTINWTIEKAVGVIEVSSTSLVLNRSNSHTATATVTTNTGTTISYSPTQISGIITMELRNGVFTIEGDSGTIETTEIHFYANGNEYYTKPQDVVITVSTAYFEFGAGEGEAADAEWFTNLQNYLQGGGTGASLRATDGHDILGKTKTITLTSSVLGTTSHLIRVIGVDQDAPNTVTFQTANCLNNNTVFGSNVQWIGSTARAECQNYYNAFPAKSAIMTVSKGTCPSTNDSRAGTVTYNDETVWLPSEREMGLDYYSPLSVANSTNSNAECTQGRNFSYSYYTSDNSRIKKLGDNGSAYYYWERSRYHVSNYSDQVCGVYQDGDASTYSYFDGDNGLAPAFVIG